MWKKNNGQVILRNGGINWRPMWFDTIVLLSLGLSEKLGLE